MRYHARFVWRNQTRYGLIDEHSTEAKRLAKKKQTLVECAIGPQRMAVPNKDVTDLTDRMIPNNYRLHKSGIFWGGTECDDFVSLCNLVARIREESLPKSNKLQVHQQFSVGVADGSANYVVTKVMKVNCDVEWRGWCLDRYYDHYFGNGGRFPIKTIERYAFDLFPSDEKSTKDYWDELKNDWESRFGDLPESEFLTLF